MHKHVVSNLNQHTEFQQTMRNKFVIIILIFVSFNIQSQIKKSELESREGIQYEIGKENPYTGKVYTYYESNEIESLAEFKNGILNGEIKNWYLNGKLQVSGRMLNGEKDGIWFAWFANGNKIREGKYINNKEEGNFKWWFENGKIKKEGIYKNGVTNGKWTWYFENGKKESEGKLLNDRNIGKWFWWNEKGELIHEKDFSNQENKLKFKKLERLIIGKWEYIKTIDKENNPIQHTIRKYPNGEEMKIIASGPDITINKDGTYKKKFTENNTDYGNWKFISEKEIEYEMFIPRNSRQGKLIIQTQKLLPNKKWKQDENGNFLDSSTDKIIEMTENEMKVEYEKDYVLIYKKKSE
jgi:antitoxin component YwqK of YwqJK toxin-antitoxin module